MKKRNVLGRLAAAALAALMLLTSAACAKTEAPQPDDSVGAASTTDAPAPARTVKVAALSGPTGIGLAKLAKDGQESGAYDVRFVGSPDEITGLLTTGEVDAACVPTNLASVLYNKTGGEIRTAAVTTLGVLYIIDASGEVQSISDLAGKTIGATGQGSNPEYILDYVLEKNGLADVTVEYYAEHAELASRMLAGDVEIGMLPVPFATQVCGKLEGESVVDLQAEWAKVADAPVAQGVLVCAKKFADEEPELLAKLLEDGKASSDFANGDIPAAAQIVEELGVLPSAALTEQAIPSCNITFVTGDEMKPLVGDFLTVLFEANPKAVGGKLPEEDFYA